jgi:hypothetical protein
MVVRSHTGGRMLALAFAAAARGVRAVSRTPAMRSFVVDHLRIEPKTPFVGGRIALDGELVSSPPPLEYRFVPEGLKVVVRAVEPR